MAAPPRILAVATAVPEHRLDRQSVIEHAGRIFGQRGADLAPMLPVYANSGIERRYSCVPLSWHGCRHGWGERNRMFLEHAVRLAEDSARRCLDEAGVAPDAIDALVSVSTTGIATPSLDALLVDRLSLRRDVQRLPIFGLGCAGGTLGLARAAAMARAQPGARVLMVVVELCCLTFRADDLSKSNIVATALFGDGAAAVLLGDGDGPAVTGWGEHLWEDSLDVMGWRVEDDGFGVLFSRDIPSLVRTRFRAPLDRFLAGQGLTLDDIAAFACHPGGAKVVAALEEALDLAPGTLAHERAVLRDYGNMSAATVLFVLKRFLADGLAGRTLMTALGPGFTAGFLLIEPAA